MAMWEALIAVGTFGQFIVVLAAALFALRQLRVLRRQTELQATLPFLTIQRSPEYTNGVVALRKLVADPPTFARIDAEDWWSIDLAGLRWIGNFFNEIGILTHERLIDGDTVLWNYRFHILLAWDALLPYTAHFRTVRNYPNFWAPFEALAVRARAASVATRYVQVRERLPVALRADYDRSREGVLDFAKRCAPE
jgi:hypothetical protein